MEAPGVSDGTNDRKITFSEIFGIGEYRALFTATQLSWIGDYMARAAIMAIVFVQTQSVALAAAAFAITYAPWVLGGPFLATLTERLRYRKVMVVCDVLRACLIASVALPGMPLPAMLLVVLGVAVLAPPAQAARSATLPLVLTGERVVLGIAVNQASAQATQVIGYLAGALIAGVNPQVALLINAGTFLTSAFILRSGLRDRPPAMPVEQRSNLLRETAEGFQVVFGTPHLRMIAVIVFASMLWVILPEGLAIGWAEHLAAGEVARRGFYQGLIMIANPLGTVLGGLLISRLLRPSVRRRLIPIFAVLAPLSLVPALTDPGIVWVAAMATASGLVMAGMTPTLNGLFVQILRHGYRARAFGVMNSGIQVIQGLAVLCGGLLTTQLPLHQVVGIWAVAGVVVMSVLAARWPALEYFDDAIAETDRVHRAAAQHAQAAGAVAVPAQGPTADPVANRSPADRSPADRSPAGRAAAGRSGEPGTMKG
jgi:MFS family permease